MTIKGIIQDLTKCNMENVHTKQMQHMMGLIKKHCSHKVCDGSGTVEEKRAVDNIISVPCLCQSDEDNK
jgi:hypothetical protein